MFNAEFFPTSRTIARKMLARISRSAKHFLEPQAGKGDLAEAIKDTFGYGYRDFEVDCIEIEPELVAILTAKGFPVVGHDWLEYSGVSYYDAIIMNPPFSNGDAHLLKAWDFLHHGEIVCLLNEETIKNPHTAARKRLAGIIEQFGDVEYLGDCFSDAERKTDVRVAMIYLKKVSDDDAVDLWATSTDERAINDFTGEEHQLPALIDKLGNMEHHYNQANEHMMKAFQHIRKAAIFMGVENTGVDGKDLGNILEMAGKNITGARAEFLRAHRQSAWKQVLEKTEFRKWLDKKQKEEFVRDIERNANIPFTKENIKGTLQNIFLQRGKLFEKSVANVFDELTKYFKGNTNHTEGWKSNDGYKVNKKLVFPWGCKYEKLWGFSMYHYGRIDIYQDLDRVLCVLDGKPFDTCLTIEKAMRKAFDAKTEMEAESEFFNIRFFKKGTVHLVFKDDALRAEFNKTAAKGKAWIGQETK